MKKPKVSIILPVHNSCHQNSSFLRKSIESCLSQTFKDIELLIVNDASTDETLDVALEYSKNDARVKLLSSEVNLRLPGALNLGHIQSSGEFVTWTSDDNYFSNDAIERLVGVLIENQEVDIVHAKMNLIENSGRTIGIFHSSKYDHLAFRSCIGGCFLYRRNVFDELGGYDATKFLVEDYDFWIRASLKFQFLYLEEPLYFYRLHDFSLTSTRQIDISKETRRLVLDYIDKLPYATRTITAFSYWQIASIDAELGDFQNALRHCFKAIATSPSSLFARPEFVYRIIHSIGASVKRRALARPDS